MVALHYVLLAPHFRKQRGGAKIARGHVASAWRISDQRVRAAIRTEGPWARKFVAEETQRWQDEFAKAPKKRRKSKPPVLSPVDQARAMLVRVNAYAVEYAEDLAPLDHPK